MQISGSPGGPTSSLARPLGVAPGDTPTGPVDGQHEGGDDIPAPTRTEGRSRAHTMSRPSYHSGGSYLCTLEAYTILCLALLSVGLTLYLRGILRQSKGEALASIPFLALFVILAFASWIVDPEEARGMRGLFQPQIDTAPPQDTTDPLEEERSVHSLFLGNPPAQNNNRSTLLEMEGPNHPVGGIGSNPLRTNYETSL